MRVADRANLFKIVSDNFRRRQHSGIDFVLVRIIRTDSGDESSGSNVFLVNEKFFRGRTGHNDIAAFWIALGTVRTGSTSILSSRESCAARRNDAFESISNA